MPYKKGKRRGNPLFFFLLILLVLALPTAFVLIGMEAQSTLAQPVSSTAVSSEATTSADTPPFSSQGETTVSSAVSIPDPVVSLGDSTGGIFFSEKDIARIEAVIRKSMVEAAAYVPPEESSVPDTSAPASSSQLSQFDRPEVYGQQISIYFKDIESGEEFWYNPDEKYFVASLIKAPYAMYLYDLAARGEISLDDTISITEKDIMEGTGILQKLSSEELPRDYSIAELLQLIIRESDNTAMKALLRKFPADGYLEYAMGLGIAYPEDVRFVTNGRITARDAGVYLNALLNFLKSNPYAQTLRDDMLHTKNPMISSKAPVVRKYGWASLSFHDMALVEGEHPYLLAILTDKDMGRQEDYRIFRELSSLFESLLNEKYNAPQ